MILRPKLIRLFFTRFPLNMLLFFIFVLVMNVCKRGPQVFPRENYFARYKIQKNLSNPLDVFDIGNPQEMSGMYTLYKSGLIAVPALSIFQDSTLNYVFLKDSIDAEYGDYVTMWGKIDENKMRFVRGVDKQVRVILADSFHVIKSTHHLLNLVNSYYLLNRKTLHQTVKNEQSKLEFPLSPEWNFFMDINNQQCVFFIAFADLMYAADLAFVYDLKSSQLKEIFVNEWFKGE